MEEEDRRWEAMDMDCLFIIFSKLGLEALDDLSVSIPFVCRSWSAAARNPLSWRILNFRSNDFMPWSSLAKRFKAQYQISRFSFSGFFKLAVRHSHGLASELWLPPCPRLRKLGLPNLTLNEERHIPSLMSKWKELQQLELESKPSNFSQLAAMIGQNCNDFIELKMPSSAISKEDVLAIIKFLPKLRTLDLSRSYLPKKELLLIVEGCRELERLSVKNCVGFEADEEVKTKACRIEKFEYEGSKMDYEGGFEVDECDDLYVDLRLDDLTTSVPFVSKSWYQASSHSNLHQILDFHLLYLNPSSSFSKMFSYQMSIPRFTFSGFLKLAIEGATFELRFSSLFPPSMEVLSLASIICLRLKILCLPRINFDDEVNFFKFDEQVE
ncbi:hypothetical protein IEQ34_013169 [Dendrobium chrysotoxum]|uniref:F-box protein n=1 Tax=Dendrobium chrysotoxum TaxID=161865 RepID=A0AAV7GQ83_DENCH|nr:hypothetical protein IEQ34_013169 [Dendrobium chrysotoxum]